MTGERHLKKKWKEVEIWRVEPQELSRTQFQVKMDIYMGLLFSLYSQRHTFTQTRDIITGDEKWVTYVNVTRKRQCLQSCEAGHETAKPKLHLRIVMLSVRWNADGVVNWELLPNGSTFIVDQYYRNVDELASKVRGKQSNI
ncbi:transposase [Oesophagostomum dentatum]|uniref:Transposase n=1 Tax=Oesophagostomum dentatum TaxID=61180 RepID=A0A0B1SPL9_OESDE|nr:transposase [Oesophagostomum dentatum]